MLACTIVFQFLYCVLVATAGQGANKEKRNECDKGDAAQDAFGVGSGVLGDEQAGHDLAVGHAVDLAPFFFFFVAHCSSQYVALDESFSETETSASWTFSGMLSFNSLYMNMARFSDDGLISVNGGTSLM